MKKMWLAIAFSIVFPGLGHLYLGIAKKGVYLLIANGIATILSFFLIGLFLWLGLMIYAIYDVYKQVPLINQQLEKQSLL